MRPPNNIQNHARLRVGLINVNALAIDASGKCIFLSSASSQIIYPTYALLRSAYTASASGGSELHSVTSLQLEFQG